MSYLYEEVAPEGWLSFYISIKTLHRDSLALTTGGKERRRIGGALGG